MRLCMLIAHAWNIVNLKNGTYCYSVFYSTYHEVEYIGDL